MWCGHIYILMTEKYYETAGTWVLQLHLRPIYPTTSFQVAIHIGSISTGAKGHHQWTFPPDISGCYLETLRLVNTYDHIFRLCNHMWLHFPSDTTWVWTHVMSSGRNVTAWLARFKVHATTPCHCLLVFRTSTQCVIVDVALSIHTLTHCIMVFTFTTVAALLIPGVQLPYPSEGYDLIHQSIWIRLAWPPDEGYHYTHFYCS